MSKRNWKRVQPTSLRSALELTKDHAREVHNRSTEQLADRMGLPDHFALYKWIAEARMPICQVRPFESACGIKLVTRYMAHSAEGLFIDIPRGRVASPERMAEFQHVVTSAVSAVMGFYAGRQDKAEALALVEAAMEGLAFHDRNIRAYETPELPFGEEGGA